MMRQFLLILLAASIAPIHAQTSAKPQVVLPPLHAIQPLEVGPPRGPQDEMELSPTPVDQEVEHPLLAEITIFEHEPAPEAERHSTDSSNSRIDTRSVRIATDGVLWGGGYSGYTFVGEFQGWGGGRPLSSDSLAKVKSLIAALPPDHGRIPTRNHKVQVEIATGYGTEKRMYDATNLPEPLLEIFQLTDTLFMPLVPEFAPDPNALIAKPPAARAKTVMAISHSWQVRVDYPGRLNPNFDVDVQEAREVAAGVQHREPVPGEPPPSAQVVSREGQALCEIPALPLLVGHQTRYTDLRTAWFTPDDLDVVFSTTIPAPLIFDARTCEPIYQLPAIPAGAVDFEPSPDWKYAVVAFPSGEIDLWNIGAGQRISRIDFGDRLLRSVTWSPTDEEVAVFTVAGDTITSHFRVYETQTGRLQRELLPFEQRGHQVATPLWWPDGKYLLASTETKVGIWNVKSGRYRGTFLDANCSNQGEAPLRLEGRYLVMECDNQSPIAWDADSAIRAISAFEDSLNTER